MNAPRPTIAFFPASSGNAYIHRMHDLLERIGAVQWYRPREDAQRFLRGDWRRVDYLFVNWLENDLIDRRSGRITPAGILRFLIRATLIRLRARQVVFVRHNLYPHPTRPRSIALARRLIDAYERRCDLVLVHSGVALQARRHYVPHPLYQRVPHDDKPVPALPGRYFLVFGRIAPYKKIDVLMRHFPAHRALVISGAVEELAYSEQLARLAAPHVHFEPGYLSEARTQQLIEGCSAVIIAHSDSNVMVSGTFFYAMTLRRPVFAVRTPFLEWMAARLGDGITLADDIPQRCESIAMAPDALTLPATDRIEAELGDAVVLRALRKMLNED